MTLAQRIIVYASWYKGKKEKKGNSGFEDPVFEKEMKGIGWYLQAAWCAFFTKLLGKKAIEDDSELMKDPAFLKAWLDQANGSAKQTFDRVKKAGFFETGSVPEAGCLVIWLLGDGPSGHAGIVESVNTKTNTMYTIEGNTNGSGSREGDQVAGKPRTINREPAPGRLNVYGYIYLRRKKK